jgi:hypothetical protein
MKLEFSQQIKKKNLNMKFQENPPSGSRDVLCGRKDRHDEAYSRSSQFTNALRNLMRNFCSLLWQEMDLIAWLIPNAYVCCTYLLEVFCFHCDCTCQTKDVSDWLNFHYMRISCHQEYGTEFEMCSWLSRDSYLFRRSCLCLCAVFQTELSTALQKRQISWLNL